MLATYTAVERLRLSLLPFLVVFAAIGLDCGDGWDYVPLVANAVFPGVRPEEHDAAATDALNRATGEFAARLSYLRVDATAKAVHPRGGTAADRTDGRAGDGIRAIWLSSHHRPVAY